MDKSRWGWYLVEAGHALHDGLNINDDEFFLSSDVGTSTFILVKAYKIRRQQLQGFHQKSHIAQRHRVIVFVAHLLLAVFTQNSILYISSFWSFQPLFMFEVAWIYVELCC